jgi:hypothetical protein
MEKERADYPLIEAITRYRAKIIMFASTWLELGYHAFGIWGTENNLLFCWPESAWEEMSKMTDTDLTLSVPAKVGTQTIGKTGVFGGTKTPAREARLDAEVSLFSEMVTMKAKFKQAARELAAQAQLKAEIEVAAKIQSLLLPQKLPQVPGLDIYALSHPAEQVGGDFYDFSIYENRPFVFAIGDISGKGLPAALLMTIKSRKITIVVWWTQYHYTSKDNGYCSLSLM